MNTLKKYKKMNIVVLLALAIGGLIFTLGAEAGKDIVITAEKVKSDPASLDAKEWKEAKAVKVILDGAGQFEKKKKEILAAKRRVTRRGRRPE